MVTGEAPAEDVWEKKLPDDWPAAGGAVAWCKLPSREPEVVLAQPSRPVPFGDRIAVRRLWFFHLVAVAGLVLGLISLFRKP